MSVLFYKYCFSKFSVDNKYKSQFPKNEQN